MPHPDDRRPRQFASRQQSYEIKYLTDYITAH